MHSTVKQMSILALGILVFVVPAGIPIAAAQECASGECEGPSGSAIGVPGQVYDSDWDGIGDTSESYWGTDPHSPDTDGDGIRDGDEFNDVYARSDPTLSDTDGDGLGDGYEVFSNNSDPMLYDTDGDGMADGADQSPRDPYRS
jgi:hypothetical protein